VLVIDYDKLATAILKQLNLASSSPTPVDDNALQQDTREVCPPSQVHSPASSTDTMNTSGTTAQSISQIVNNILLSGEPATPIMSNKSVCLTDGIPLATAIPPRLKAKIW
jgi:hypothetical protein